MSEPLLSVLLVDDELPLREELRRYPWEEHGFELVGEAVNGVDALRFCQSCVPDVVITDITMPRMDGLELFHRLNEQYALTKVVLLTCHSEFAYAQKAVQLGAVDYLVKYRMQGSDLERALNKAKEALRRDYSMHRNEIEKLRLQQSRTLALYAAGVYEDRTDLEKLLRDTWKLAFPFRLAALHVKAKPENRLLIKQEVEDALSRLEGAARTFPFTWLPAEEGVYLLLPRQEESCPDDLKRQTEEICRSLSEAIENRLSFLSEAVRLYAVVGERVNGPEVFLKCFRRVTEEHPQHFYEPGTLTFDLSDGRNYADPDDAASAEMLEKLRFAKGNRDMLAENLRHELPRWARSAGIHPDTLREWAVNRRSLWLEDLDERGGRYSANVRAIAEAPTLDELVSILVHELEAPHSGQTRMRKEIADAVRYIDDHLEGPVTLTAVARHIGFSAYYLSRLFREETGISFNEYIAKQRIAKAVHLLQTTSLRVYEVGNAVGIPSYRYFTALFRKYTGLSPTEYRKG
ncbi:two-component system, response regulator YesN [Paenibacillus sp. UNCCL117]|uniref:response regulator n=1 Tax=unclassified Paenibacillus TaxID=185978 RepID=UPI00089138BC|nr:MULTISPECIES: response regulator [unclassified Paenibacillus]SDC96279.1 two-component system, response regulator YesN [Paenibacillus sp. cl123]SFW30262.1 two-component system, response regulator YesN [Paenibacillus sp. UNCCL117]